MELHKSYCEKSDKLIEIAVSDKSQLQVKLIHKLHTWEMYQELVNMQ